MRIGKFQLYKAPPDTISKNSVWIFIDHYKGYLYANENLLKLLFVILTKWRHDRHLVG